MSQESQDHQCSVVSARGSRVNLRPIMEADVPYLLRWINDPEITQYLNVYLPMSEAEEREWVKNLHKDKTRNIVFMIVVDGKPIGTMGLHGINWKSRVATTGALIGEKEYWGRGYGTEAKMLLLNYAFNNLNLRKICSSVLAFNGRSAKALQKCGYKKEGFRKDQYFHDGTYWDEVLFAVFREDWLPLWDEYVRAHNIPVVKP